MKHASVSCRKERGFRAPNPFIVSRAACWALLSVFLIRCSPVSAASPQSGARLVREALGRSEVFLDLIEAQDPAFPARANRIAGRRLSGAFQAGAVLVRNLDAAGDATARGVIAVDGLNVGVSLQAARTQDPSIYDLTLQFETGKLPPRFLVRQAGLRLPLSLPGTLRVAAGGDRGVHWDTASEYEILAGGKPTNPPDIYRWALFGVLQDSPRHYRMWKAESDKTSSLTMMQGIAAPGWMDLGNAENGLAVACREFAQRAPAELFADTRAGGMLVFYAHSPHARPLDSRPVAQRRNPGTENLGRPYRLTLCMREGPWSDSRTDRRIAAHWGIGRFANDAPMAAYPSPAEDSSPAGEGDADAFVSSGVPFPRGAVKSPQQVRLLDGTSDVPLQTRVLAYWPDRSVKWLLLTFPQSGKGFEVSGGSGDGGRIPIHVDSRLGRNRTFTLVFGENVRAATVRSGLQAVQEAYSVSVDTGKLSFRVAPGECGFLNEVSLADRSIVPPASQHRNFLDHLHAETSPAPCESAVEGVVIRGRTDVLPGVIVEEAGPLRATILVRGHHENADLSHFTVRIQAYANRSYLRVFNTFTYMGADTRRDFLCGAGMRLPLQLEKSRHAIAGIGNDAAILKGARAGLSQPDYLSSEAWQAATGEAGHVVARGGKSDEWLAMGDGTRGCAVVLRNMWREGPKEIEADLETGEITAWLWPPSANVLDLRLYSNLPHVGSGESLWYRGFEPGAPFEMKGSRFARGVSKTHELLFYFYEGDAAAAQVASVAADFRDPSFAFVTPEWYAASGALGAIAPADAERLPKIEANIVNFFDFMLLHQDFWGWYGMLDHGDWGHKFMGSYNSFSPQHGWFYDFGRWGWTNTEGLPSRFMHLQFFRTGERRYYFASEAMARHNRDVDIYRDGPFALKGTRHGVNHWSDGYKDERIAMAWPFRYDYLLRGDPMSREMILKLVDKRDLEPGRPRGDWPISRPIDLLAAWEMTGDARYRDVLQNLCRAFIHERGIGSSPQIEMPSGKAIAPPEEVNSRTMFFHYFGALYALIEYCDLTRDQTMIDALLRMWRSDAFLSSSRPGPLPLYTFAARYEPDPELRKQAVDTIRSVMRGGGRGDFIYHSTVHELVPRDRGAWLAPDPGFVGFAVSPACFYVNAAPHAIPFVEKEVRQE